MRLYLVFKFLLFVFYLPNQERQNLTGLNSDKLVTNAQGSKLRNIRRDSLKGKQVYYYLWNGPKGKSTSFLPAS